MNFCNSDTKTFGGKSLFVVKKYDDVEGLKQSNVRYCTFGHCEDIVSNDWAVNNCTGEFEYDLNVNFSTNVP